jgi:DNA repair exonuclease SbcCD nuclease subunit
MNEIDVIFISGDLFDSDLPLNSEDTFLIKHFVFKFLRRAKKYNIAVRVLKGTPSHDWDQLRLLTTINNEAKIGCDLLYYETLTIERDPTFDIDILYVPDEYKPTCEETWLEVQELMSLKGLKKVDLAIMHGMFEFQLPNIPHLDRHSSKNYLSITNLAVICGHIHHPSQYKHIYIPGSFDRLRQNEEEDKGALRIDFKYDRVKKRFSKKHSDHIVERIINKWAKKYVAIQCEGELNDDILRVKELAESLPKGSEISLRAPKGATILTLLRDFSLSYPTIQWASKFTDAKKDIERGEQDNIKVIETPKLVTVTEENIGQLVSEKMMSRDVPCDTISWANNLLEELL